MSAARSRVALACVVVPALVLAHANDARADDGVRIAVTAIDGRAALSLRLGAELAEIGYAVIPIDTAETRDAASQNRMLARTHAIAALTIEHSDGGMMACVIEQKELRRTCRQVSTTSENVEDAAIATRAAELLRTILVDEVPLPPARTPRKQAQNESPETTSAEIDPDHDEQAPIDPSFEVRMGPGVMLPNGAPAELSLGLGADWIIAHNFALGLDAMVPITSASIERPQGSASVHATSIAGRADARYATGHWETSLGAGMGLLWLQVNGTASSPVQGIDDALVDPFIEAHGELAAFVTRALAVRLDVTGGYVLSQLTIRFADQDVAEVGRPLAMSTLSLSLAWP